MTTLIRLYHKQAITSVMSALAYHYDRIVTLSFIPMDEIRLDVLAHHQSIFNEYHYYPEMISVDLTKHEIDNVLNSFKDADVDITSNDQHDSMRLLCHCMTYNNVFYYSNRDNCFYAIVGNVNHLKVENLHIRHSIESMGASVKKNSLHYSPKDFHSEESRCIIKQIYRIFAPSIDSGSYGLIEAFPYVLSKSNQRVLNFSKAITPIDKKALKIFNELENLGVCTVCNESKLIIAMNPDYTHIFKVMGQILEMYCYIVCLESKLFDDVKMSVTIDYNGHFKQGYYDATSEIDLIAIKDNQPIYLSCKLNKIHQEDIYEIYTNATHFGGPSSHSMVAINRDTNKITEYLLNKASELHVHIIEKEKLNQLDTLLAYTLKND